MKCGLLFTVLVLIFAQSGSAQDSTRAGRLRKVCQADSVRMIFVRVHGGRQYGFPSNSINDSLYLMRYNTETNIEDTIGKQVGSYEKPLLNHDGSKIVFTSFRKQGTTVLSGEVFVMDWQTGTQVRIARGAAYCLWYDRQSQKEYVLFGDRANHSDRVSVKRINLSDTSDFQTVWQNSTIPLVPAWFSISSDLEYIGGVFGWPAVRLLKRSSPNTYHPLHSASGCWTSMPYDTTGRLLFLTADHRAGVLLNTTGQTDTLSFGIMNNQLRLATYSRTIGFGLYSSSSSAAGNILIYRFHPSLTFVDVIAMYHQDTEISYRDAMADIWTNKNVILNPPGGGTKLTFPTSRPHTYRTGDRVLIYDIQGRRIEQTSANVRAGSRSLHLKAGRKGIAVVGASR